MPLEFGGCLINYIGPPSAPWSEDNVDTLEDILISDYSPCTQNNLNDPLEYGGGTQCDTFASIRECEANNLVENCGAAEEHMYIPGDISAKGYYVQCNRGGKINCWPISHWKCPDCPQCNPNDPNFIGCVADTPTNRDKLGSPGCPFNGALDGSALCSEIYDSLRACLLNECEQKCGSGGCVENLTGFYVRIVTIS